MIKSIELRDLISSKGIKVIPQRMRVLEAIYKLNNHPTAENILDYIRKNDSNIGSGTVYNVLETLVENQLENFNIEDIKVSINGNFIIHKKKNHD